MNLRLSPALLLFLAPGIPAGPNQNAILSVDLLPSSAAADSVDFRPANDAPFWVAVRVSGAVGLDSYGLELSYDRARLDFLQAATGLPGQGLFNFLESAGGTTAVFVGQLSRNDSSKVSIAQALAGSDSARSPDGGGILALVQFQPKGIMGDAIFSIDTAQLLDWRLTVDTGMAANSARLNLGTPVRIWETRFVGDRRMRVLLNPPGRKAHDVLGRIVLRLRTP